MKKRSTNPITHLNAAQKRIRQTLRDQYGETAPLTPTDEIRIEMMATIISEIRDLQKFINANGTTYQVVGRSGDLYSKHRPEHQQIVEARSRLHVLAGTLQREGNGAEKSIAELLAE